MTILVSARRFCALGRQRITERGILSQGLSHSESVNVRLNVAAGLAKRLAPGAALRLSSISDLIGYKPEVVAWALLVVCESEGVVDARTLLLDLMNNARGRKKEAEQALCDGIRRELIAASRRSTNNDFKGRVLCLAADISFNLL